MDDPLTSARGARDALPLDMSADEFRVLGHRVIDRLAEYLASMPDRPVAPDVTAREVRERLGQEALPERGDDASWLIDEAVDLAVGYNRLTGHPRQWGYIIGSGAPIGALGDLIAATVNLNVVSWPSAPMASEIETQAVRWLAGFLDYPADGGLLTSGGNMANFIGFLAARRARIDWDVRRDGAIRPGSGRPRVYVSRETHTWIEKAADLFGLGTEAIRWLPTDADKRLDVDALRRQLSADREAGDLPFLVVGSAGTVSTGAVDPLPEIAAVARAEGLWFHVDGAYGAPAVAASGTPADLAGLREADSLAVDAHKWLHAPLEAGCALVRDRRHLTDTFSYHPPYYHRAGEADDDVVNYHEMGPQNSRALRALKLWLLLRRAGREGLVEMLDHDLAMARELHRRLDDASEIEIASTGLSIVTFRFVPDGLAPGDAAVETYLDELNAGLVTRIQRSGEAYLSNAVLDGRYVLRVCITNFRTTAADVRALPGIVVRLGRELDAEMRPAELGGGG